MRGKEAEAWSDKLCCYWENWTVIKPGELALRLREHNCTDMGGCIETAKVIMPDVRFIQTYSGDALDTAYELINGEWTVKVPKYFKKMVAMASEGNP